MTGLALSLAVALTAASPPPAPAPPPLRATTVDLTALLDAADVTPPLRGRPSLDCVRRQPHAPFPNSYSPLSAALRPRHQRVTLAGGGPGRVEYRDAFFFKAPRAFAFPPVVPGAHPRLEFSYALFPCGAASSQAVRPGDAPATAVVTVEDADGVVTRRVPLSLTPPRSGSRWRDVAVDLPLAADRPARVRVAFEAPRGGVAVAWSRPVITAMPDPADDPTGGLNVLLVVVDALRGDVIGPALRPDLTSVTPNLDAVFAAGTSFTRAYTVSNQTRPSTFGLLAGQPPSVGGFHSRSWTLPDRRKAAIYASDPPLLTRLLLDAGWRVEHIGHNHFLWELSHIGLDHGFEGAIDFRAVPEDTVATTDEAVRFIGDHADRRWFMLLNYTAPHTPYDPPEPYASDVEARLGPMPKDGVSRNYLGEVAYVDAEIARVFAELDRRGLAERTLVIVTADHGEVMHSAHACYSERLEMRCEYNHGLTVYDEELHVPFALRLPGRVAPGHVVTTPVSHVDVAPTVLELAGLSPSPRHVGESLARDALTGGAPPQRPIYAEGRYAVAARIGDLKLIVHHRDDDVRTRARIGRAGGVGLPLYELFDLTADPDEVVNLALTDPDLAAVAAAELDAMREHLVARSLRTPAGAARAQVAGGPAAGADGAEALGARVDLGPRADNAVRFETDGRHPRAEVVVTSPSGRLSCGPAVGRASCAGGADGALILTLEASVGEASSARFASEPWDAPLAIVARVGDEVWPPDRLRLGPYGLRLLAPGEALDAAGRLMLAVASAPPRTVPDELGLYLWRDAPGPTRLAVAPEAAAAPAEDLDANMNEEVRSVLRSLGYTR